MIDWNKPLELLDGTLVRRPIDPDTREFDEYLHPDRDGDYWIEREDGMRIVSTDGKSNYKQMCVHANGCEEGTGNVIVRNRDALKLGNLIQRIQAWATQRNLIEGATSQAQMLKLTEEVGEIAAAVARNKRDDLKDGIGDAVVVLTILAAQNGLTLEECVAAAYDEIKDRKGRMVDGVFVREQ